MVVNHDEKSWRFNATMIFQYHPPPIPPPIPSHSEEPLDNGIRSFIPHQSEPARKNADTQ